MRESVVGWRLGMALLVEFGVETGLPMIKPSPSLSLDPSRKRRGVDKTGWVFQSFELHPEGG